MLDSGGKMGYDMRNGTEILLNGEMKMDLSNKLRSLRVSRNLTQEALAAAMGVSPQSVSKWERGVSLPDVSMLPELSVYFGVSMDELFGLTDEMEFDRIQNMLWDKRLLTEAELTQAERWIDAKIASGYRAADCMRLKADMYNHQAKILHEMAAESAKAALATDPECGAAFEELNTAMGGYCPDWAYRQHGKLIDYLAGFVKKHPESIRARLWLIDNLIDDRRCDEAEKAIQELEKSGGGFYPPLYRARLLWHKGERAEARGMMDALISEYPGEWRVHTAAGELAAMEGDYARGIAHIRASIEAQGKPRCDNFDTIAAMYELAGDRASAIRTLEEEVAFCRSEWGSEAGETVDAVKREIERQKAN